MAGSAGSAVPSDYGAFIFRGRDASADLAVSLENPMADAGHFRDLRILLSFRGGAGGDAALSDSRIAAVMCNGRNVVCTASKKVFP